MYPEQWQVISTQQIIETACLPAAVRPPSRAEPITLRGGPLAPWGQQSGQGSASGVRRARHCPQDYSRTLVSMLLMSPALARYGPPAQPSGSGHPEPDPSPLPRTPGQGQAWAARGHLLFLPSSFLGCSDNELIHLLFFQRNGVRTFCTRAWRLSKCQRGARV